MESEGAVATLAMSNIRYSSKTGPFVQNFQNAQQAVGLLFQETNTIMSKILGIDFGQTAGRAGGAC